jgi:hypothetical protein
VWRVNDCGGCIVCEDGWKCKVKKRTEVACFLASLDGGGDDLRYDEV